MRIMAFPANSIINAIVIFVGKNIGPEMAIKAKFLALANCQLLIFRGMRIMTLSAKPRDNRPVDKSKFIGEIIMALEA